MKTPEIKGTNILLLGYGRENKSVERFLGGHYSNISIAVTDRKTGADYLKNLDEYDTVVRSPGIPAHLPELQAYTKSGGWVTTATNIFFSVCPGKTIGITGTKGKSTTSSLIAHILKTIHPDVRLIGNIGSPALDGVGGATKNTVFVIELSSHQLADCRYSPEVAVVLNIYPEHLDYYKTMDDYVRAKIHIVLFQRPQGAVVYDRTNTIASTIAQKSKGKKIPVIGEKNTSTASAVAALFGVSKKQLQTALHTFAPLPHRLEFVGEFSGITFYNDSLATIPEATVHGIEALGPIVETLIVGGFDRGLDYAVLGDYLNKQKNIKTLILFPDTGEKIWNTTDKTKKKFDVSSMEEAVRLAYQHTHKGNICLLSPAAASFNLFKDYADRGGQFKELVKRIKPD